MLKVMLLKNGKLICSSYFSCGSGGVKYFETQSPEFEHLNLLLKSTVESMRCQTILKFSLKLKAQRECLGFPSHLGRNVDDYNQATLS